jgi:prepilin-type N-terminal cleavage/methylation domain-containing protein
MFNKNLDHNPLRFYPMKTNRNAFTLVELMVVVLIVAVLASIMAPLLTGRIKSARWSEANAGAGSIRTAVRAYFSEKPLQAQTLTGTLDTQAIQDVLGFSPQDLAGTYFVPGDYNIDSVNAQGIATITVTGGSMPDSPAGSYTLAADGTWQKN